MLLIKSFTQVPDSFALARGCEGTLVLAQDTKIALIAFAFTCLGIYFGTWRCGILKEMTQNSRRTEMGLFAARQRALATRRLVTFGNGTPNRNDLHL